MTTDQGQKVKGQGHNNPISRKEMVISTSNVVETFIVTYATRDPLPRSVGQLDRK